MNEQGSKAPVPFDSTALLRLRLGVALVLSFPGRRKKAGFLLGDSSGKGYNNVLVGRYSCVCTCSTAHAHV